MPPEVNPGCCAGVIPTPADANCCVGTGVKPLLPEAEKGMFTKEDLHMDPTVEGVASRPCPVAGVRGSLQSCSNPPQSASGLKSRGSVLGGVLRAFGDV